MKWIAALVPFMIAALFVYALIRRVNVYDAFVAGAKEALPLLKTVLPHMAAMLTVIALFRESGAALWLGGMLSSILPEAVFPAELLPLAILRPLSGSGTLAMTADLMRQYGPDSRIGMMACVLCGSSETVFYTLALYFGAVGVKRTRFTLPVALAASFISLLVTVWLFLP
ncbi:MAG: spore maturation protein [Eubacteriales bacterium]|nr:spore maturation protein [Eubacteriales bacterium]